MFCARCEDINKALYCDSLFFFLRTHRTSSSTFSSFRHFSADKSIALALGTSNLRARKNLCRAFQKKHQKKKTKGMKSKMWDDKETKKKGQEPMVGMTCVCVCVCGGGGATGKMEREQLHGSPEERSIVHALGVERLFLLQLFLDRIERVLLWHCHVPKTTR
jgi:hypothetical protein